MAEMVPVDHDPFAAANSKLVPVEHDPFNLLEGVSGQSPPTSRAWSDVPGQALQNAGPSAVEFGKNIVQPIIHPIDTATNLKNLGMGVLQKAGNWLGVENSGEYEKYADAVGHHFKERYGSEEGIKNALATDPVGVLADLSMALTGGGALVRGGAKAAELSGAAKTADIAKTAGQAIQKAGEFTDPINLAGKAVKATFGLGPEQQILEKAGVLMTPGQMMIGPKGTFKKLEDAAGSIPILGSFINSGRELSIKSFDQAVGRQVLEPIGESIKKGATGHALVKDVESKLGAAYDKLLPSLKFTPDSAFFSDWNNNIAQRVRTLPPANQQQFNNIITQHITPTGLLSGVTRSGTAIKQIESELGYYVGLYSKSQNPAERQMSQALKNIQTAIRANLERGNPAHAGELANINHGWAMYVRMREAAGRRATSSGVFTPNDLLHAIKNGDKTVAHGAFAKGDALMQTFGEAGQKVLPSTLPTSGTSERLAAMGLVGAAGAAATHSAPAWAHGATQFLANPAVLAGIAGGSLPYTKPGMYALNKAVRPIVRNIDRLRPRLGVRQGLYAAGKNDQLQRNNPYAP